MSNNLKIWNDIKRPPSSVLKNIDFGYLKGKSDINPQWRLMAMTQAFGMVGHGWTYRIVRTWSETGGDGQVMAFSEVAVKTKLNGEWGEEFFGTGGSTIVELSKGNLKSNDEGYKMATTDALSVAFKAVGVAADIYLGCFDGSKYVKDVDEAFTDTEELLEEARGKMESAKTIEELQAFARLYLNTAVFNDVKRIGVELSKKFKGVE